MREADPLEWRAMHLRVCSLLLVAGLVLTGCPAMPPPASPVPDGESALQRLRDSATCSTGLQASAKVDHFGKQGRFRGDLLVLASTPDRIRMDVVSPFGVTLATLTSDGRTFALSDLRDKRFLTGPAQPCNIARLTGLPLPGHVLVDLLRGQAPLLKRSASPPTVIWSGRGHYVVHVTSTHSAEEDLLVAPHPADMGKPWTEQRMRLVGVTVQQAGQLLYRAELADHQPAATAPARPDPDGLDAPLPPSGPSCDADLPRRIHVEVPEADEDVLFRYEEVAWNPPLAEGVFTQPRPGGTSLVPVDCADR